MLSPRPRPRYFVSELDTSEPVVVRRGNIVKYGSEIVIELATPAEMNGGLSFFLAFRRFAQSFYQYIIQAAGT